MRRIMRAPLTQAAGFQFEIEREKKGRGRPLGDEGRPRGAW